MTEPRKHRRPTHQRGFTYLWLLFIVAAGAAALAAMGQRASTAVQRDKEAELIFRGTEISRAIAAYWDATPGDNKVLPLALHDLVDDRRGPNPLHHLRRVYADPFTGKPDWVLISSDDGRISGVRSAANIAALRVSDLPKPKEGERALESDRLFVFSPVAAASGAASSPAPASSAAIRSTAGG